MRSEVISTAPSSCTWGERRRGGGGGQKRSVAGIQSVEGKRSCVVDLKTENVGRNGFEIAAPKPQGMV